MVISANGESITSTSLPCSLGKFQITSLSNAQKEGSIKIESLCLGV